MPDYSGPSEDPSGAVYNCPLTGKAEDCEQISLPKMTNAYKKATYARQFLGMNVLSSTPYNGSKVMTCAPRRLVEDRLNNKVFVPGACYSVDNSLKKSGMVKLPEDWSATTIKSAIYTIHMGGMALATNSKNEALIGCPFSTPKAEQDLLNGGELLFVDEKEQTIPFFDENFKTKPTYPGWSVAMGKILSGADGSFAAGAPGMPSEFSAAGKKEEIGKGFVYVFTYSKADKSETRRHRLIGEQFGSRFGHSLLAVDVNSDGWDDLLVGAPDYRSQRKDRLSIGSGAVYLYLNEKGKLKEKPHKVLRAPCKGANCALARFGFALSNLGDINMDGFNDVGISAPGDDGGAIYVFLGGKDPFAGGTPAQQIVLDSAKELGYSLGPGMDLDNNGYPDLVAGVLGSGSAAVFRTRPVVNIDVTLTFDPNVLDPKLSSKSACEAGDAEFCVLGTLRFMYKPASAAHKMSEDLPGSITIVAEPGREGGSRIRFKSKGLARLTKKVNFKKSIGEEKIHLIIKADGFMDVLRPINFKFSWAIDLKQPKPLDSSKTELPSINEFPVYDKKNSFATVKLPWRNDCPKEGCKSSLQLRMQTSLLGEDGKLVYFVGRDKEIWLNFTVSNHLGTAHLVELRLTMPDSLVVDKWDCQFPCQEGKTKCGVANPLASGATTTCKVRLSTANLKPEMRKINFEAKLTTTSEDTKKYQTAMNFTASVQIQANVYLTGRVNHNQLVYKDFKPVGISAIQHENKIGDPRFQITFEVENRLNTLLPSSVLTILWPHELLEDTNERHGKYLLYLLAAPLIDSKWKKAVHCDQKALNQLVNPVGVRLQIDDLLKNYSITAKPKSPIVKVPIGKSKTKPELLPCSNGLARCVPIKCTLGRLGKTTGAVSIKFLARVWVHTLISNFAHKKFVEIDVEASWKSDPQFDVVQINGSTPNATIRLTDKVVLQATSLMELKEEQPRHFLWIIIGASVGGLILLGCIIIVLWKCKFFQRKNLDKERQRLVRESRMRPTEAESFFSERPA